MKPNVSGWAIFTIYVFYGTILASLITNWIWVFKLLVSDVVLTSKMVIVILLSLFPWFSVVHGIIIWFNGWTFL